MRGRTGAQSVAASGVGVRHGRRALRGDQTALPYPRRCLPRSSRGPDCTPWPSFLEIAPGSHSRPCRCRGRRFCMTGVELGAGMMRLAGERLYPRVTILNAAFEAAVRLPVATTSSTSPRRGTGSPRVRFVKSHALLKPSGHLSVIPRHHVSEANGASTSAIVVRPWHANPSSAPSCGRSRSLPHALRRGMHHASPARPQVRTAGVD
jgi:hypothetical protein